LLAFALLCVVTAAAVAGGSYVQARNAILQRTQDAAVQAMTSRLETLYPLRSPAPGPAELGEIAGTVTDRNSSAVAVYHEAHSLVGLDPPVGLDPGVIPPELRRAVAGGDIAWQRVVWQGEPT
jgi:two-component system sensor histidine kinase MtrB